MYSLFCSILLLIVVLHSFSFLNNFPFYKYTSVYSPIVQLIDIYDNSILGQLWTMLLWTLLIRVNLSTWYVHIPRSGIVVSQNMSIFNFTWQCKLISKAVWQFTLPLEVSESPYCFYPGHPLILSDILIFANLVGI